MGNLAYRQDTKDLVFLKELLESGKIAPVVDRCYPLEALPEALRHFGEGHARGKIVLTVEHRERATLGDVPIVRDQSQLGGNP